MSNSKIRSESNIIKKVSKDTKRTQYFRDMMRDVLRDKYLYILLIPCLLFYIFFAFKPLYGLQIAFKDYSLFKGIEASPWVGFDNFRTFFESPYVFRLIKNTLLINVYGLVFGFPVPIILALIFNEVKNEKFKRTAQTISYLPHFVSTVIVAGLVVNFLAPSGMINNIIALFGGERTYFLTQPQYFRGIFTGMNVWKESGFGAVIYISALASIDPQLYEAAVVDGANRWKQTLHVTLPGILPTITIMLILRIGRMLSVGFESVLLLQQPATYETSDVISTYVYRLALTKGIYDVATAVDLINAIVALALVFAANKFAKKFSETSLW